MIMGLAMMFLLAAGHPAPGADPGVGARFSAGGREYVVETADALPYVENEYSRRFHFDSHENPKLRALREQYRLDEVVAGGKDEFERQILLLDWVNHQLRKFGTPSCEARGAMEILQANGEGHTFFCAHYADVMVSAAASMGWVCRNLALRRPDHIGSGSTEHSSTEIWSNQHRKWIMLDPTFAMYIEKEGVPLNAYEFRQEWFVRGGEDLVYVLDKDRKRYRKSDLPVFRSRHAGFGDLVLDGGALNVYAFIGYIPNTNFMDAGKDYGKMFITQDEIGGATKWHRRQVPEHPATEPYFPIGQAALSLAAEGEGLRVTVRTLTPNLKGFLSRVDGGEWLEVEPAFLWKLKGGENRLEVKTVNAFGVEGPVSTVLVREETKAAAGLEPIRDVAIGENRELRVNGTPFFPLSSWAQSPRRFPLLRELGFNTFVGGSVKRDADAAREAGGYAMPHFDDTGKGHPAVLAYIHGDEPDLGIDKGTPRKSAESVVEAYERIKKLDGNRPVFLNLTSGFMDRSEGDERKTPHREYYGVVTRGADILSFDVYPIYGYNKPEKLNWVADGVTALREYAGTKPVFACIETAKGSRWITYERQLDVLPEHTRAEVWMAIIRGATGIVYFTHAWRPEFTEFAPTEAMRAELKRLNGQITRLAPVILSAPAQLDVSISFAGGLAGEVMARGHEGSIYLFANNLDMQRRSGTATLRVEGLKKGMRIEVVDEGREIVAEEGEFRDEFAPLGVHIYRLRQ